ncbi:MAG: proteasome accessory factor PafA2 family protein, partial [Nitriliruptoraceae bacterium]
EAYRARHDLPLGHPRVQMIDLSYHDVVRSRGLYHLLARQGRVQRLLDEADIVMAMTEPPVGTRAALRGRFIRAAKQRRRDFTVDWVHLKLNDQAQRTVLCKDPFRSEDERVDRLIESM